MEEVQHDSRIGKYRIIDENERVEGYVLKQAKKEIFKKAVILEHHFQDESAEWKVERVPFMVPNAILKKEYDMKMCLLLAREKIGFDEEIIYVERGKKRN